ncbi:Bromo adjacent homology (BAH) domain [Arabidopsis suecica]|uniref:Bromo adjacent homology (BAH) domain n=1 Tax=Arabidopsis suecica TaxID=45249 RepID=A0A8T2CG79_ARASU|nr:Bromo adjacent homology (BAH) domain [Arabidopsis suecica]
MLLHLWCYALQISTNPYVITTHSELGKPNYIAKIIEMFEADDGEPYCRVRWFYRPDDTVRCYYVLRLLDSLVLMIIVYASLVLMTRFLVYYLCLSCVLCIH